MTTNQPDSQLVPVGSAVCFTAADTLSFGVVVGHLPAGHGWPAMNVVKWEDDRFSEETCDSDRWHIRTENNQEAKAA